MVTAELHYNPYLSETEIKFNGRMPHVNSLIYKYQDCCLEDWITRLPAVFRDEMNGYYFHLKFWGTYLDYNELRAAFRKLDIDERQVSFSLQTELGAREIKLQDVANLLIWLQNNRNRAFDYSDFRDNNPDLAEINYSLILIHGNEIDIPAINVPGIHIENVLDIAELEGADLTNHPIVYIVDDTSLEMMYSDITWLLNSASFKQQQLFVYITDSTSIDRIRKTLRDIGIAESIVISTLNDDALIKYCLFYPVTDYIHEVIVRLREIVNDLRAQEADEQRRHESTNEEAYKNLESIERTLTALKDAHDSFRIDTTVNLPTEWQNCKTRAVENLSKWKAGKIQATSESEAVPLAQDLSKKMIAAYRTYANDLRQAALKYQEQCLLHYHQIYQKAEIDHLFEPDIYSLTLNENSDVPRIDHELLKKAYISTRKCVESRRRNKILHSYTTTTEKIVNEMIYPLSEWRSYATGELEKYIDQLQDDWYPCITDNLNEIRSQYIRHLTELIEKYTSERNIVASQLSDDEQQFQEDMRWLAEFESQLIRIEQG